jgi:hypothetical protein
VTTQHLFRALGRLALWGAYGAERVRSLTRGAFVRLAPRRNWRTVKIGQIAVSIPSDWGDVEPDIQGGYVVHNRPHRFRMDGDAVWYSSAIELRIRRPDMIGTFPSSPMAETIKTITCAEGPVVLAMAIANGVGPAQRCIALRVLQTARAETRGQPITWREAWRDGETEVAAAPFHPRVAAPLRPGAAPHARMNGTVQTKVDQPRMRPGEAR